MIVNGRREPISGYPKAPVAAAQAVTTQAARGAEAMISVGERTSQVLIWLATAAAAFVVLFLRRPETLLQAEFYADDSKVWLYALVHGPISVLFQHGGSLILAQGLLTLPETWVPPYWAPVVANVTALAAAALVAAFLASDRMAALLPRRLDRLILAAAFVLMPGSLELFGTMSHLQWITGAWLLALVVATPGRRAELILVAIACLTGPIVIFLLPLYAARWWWRRDNRPMLAVAAVCALVQVAVLLLTVAGRPTPLPPDWSLVPTVLVERILPAGPYAVGLLGLIVIATIDVAWRWRLLAGAVILAIPIAGLNQTDAPTRQFLDEVSAARYFWLSTAIVVGGLLAARTRRIAATWARRVALAGFAVIFVAGARIPAIASTGWAEGSRCIGGPTPCAVPVAPSELWTIRWPGDFAAAR